MLRSGTGFALGNVPLGRRQRRLDGSRERDQWRNVVDSLISTARSVAFGGLMLVGVGVSTSANATIISGTYDVTGTGFTAVGPSAPVPFNNFTASVTLSFDNTTGAINQPVTTATANIPFSQPVVYTYLPLSDTLLIGAGGNTTILGNANDFQITIKNVSTLSPSIPFFVTYTTEGTSIMTFFNSVNEGVTFTPTSDGGGGGGGGGGGTPV